MLTDLFNWWKEQMRDLVPASLRPSSGRTWRRTLVIVPDTPDLSSVELFLQSRGGETSLGRHGLDARERTAAGRSNPLASASPNDA